jgi:hypothetical protein
VKNILIRQKFMLTFLSTRGSTPIHKNFPELDLSRTWKLRVRYCYLPPRSFSFPMERLRTYWAKQSEKWREVWLVGDHQGSVRLGCQRMGNQSQSKGWASLASSGEIRRENLPRQSSSRCKVGFYPRREKAKGWLLTGTLSNHGWFFDRTTVSASGVHH